MHGVGARFTLEALARAGFANVHPVPEQNEPDGAFPTVSFPNPEEPGALDLALALCEKTKADLLLANDPDADRLAAGARDRDGRMRLFSGNELGVLLGAYCLTWRTPRPEKPLVLTTIVSSSQLGDDRPRPRRGVRRDADRLQVDREPRPRAGADARAARPSSATRRRSATPSATSSATRTASRPPSSSPTSPAGAAPAA